PMDVCLLLFFGSSLLISACWRTFVVTTAHLMEGFCHRSRGGHLFWHLQEATLIAGFPGFSYM
ncbi:unnamed protein product, partial [Rangifer tarandus platyrhynchus]